MAISKVSSAEGARGMHSKLLGVRVKPCAKIMIGDFLTHLASDAPDLNLPGGGSRYFHGAFRDDYFVGLVITKKGHKTLLEVRPEEESFALTPRTATAGSDWADFNALILNKATGKGLYLVHKGSCSTFALHSLLNGLYKKYRDGRVKLAIGEEQDKAKRHAIAKPYAGQLDFIVLVKREAFAATLAKCQRVVSVKLKIETVKVKEPWFAPLAKVASSEYQEFTFSKSVAMDDIIAGIVEAAEDELVTGGSAATVNADGLEGRVRFGSNPDSFGFFDVDELTRLFENFDPDKFSESTIVDRLVAVMKENGHLFNLAS